MSIGYVSFTSNAAGLAAISKIGITKLATLLSADFDNIEPSWVAAKSSYFGGYFVDNATNKPYLEITYSTGETASYTPVSLVATIPSITATATYKAIFTALSYVATIPTNTATYVCEKIADFTSLSLKQTIPAITATFTSYFTATFSALSLIFNIPIFRHWKNQTKHSATGITNQTKHNATGVSNQTKHSASNVKNQKKK
jgi:hypothetical protein